MKILLKITVILLIITSFTSCGRDMRNRKVQYMPDMYRPVPYEAYSTNPNFADGLSSQQPVAGTVSRGAAPYDYPNTEAGYQAAKADLKSPLEANQIDYVKGKKAYDIYCAACHNTNGDGNGILSQRDKFVGIPNYNSREITDGSIYHVIMHGRNMMGSHASQLQPAERWQVVHYVQKLKTELTK